MGFITDFDKQMFVWVPYPSLNRLNICYIGKDWLLVGHREVSG